MAKEQKERILIVEDDPQIANFIKYLLRQEGFPYDLAAGLKEAKEAMAYRPADLILLDLGLPDGDGIDFLKEIRNWSEAPVIVISARDQDAQKVQALDLGADDYLTKPFSPAELMARIRVARRHLHKLNALNTKSTFEIKELKIDYARREVFLKGKLIHLSPLEYRLLALMAQNAGKVLTTRYLIDQLYGPAYGDDTQSLRQLMAGLRRKIEDSSIHPEYIKTETGVGYRLLDQ